MITAKVKRIGLLWTIVVSNGIWEADSVDQIAKRLEISKEQLVEMLKSYGAIRTEIQNMNIMGWWEKGDAEKVLPNFDYLILMASMVSEEKEY